MADPLPPLESCLFLNAMQQDLHAQGSWEVLANRVGSRRRWRRFVWM